MNDQLRQERLAAIRNTVGEVGAHTAEVLAAMDATLADFPAPTHVPDNTATRDALETELATLRAELLAATAARTAIDARYREISGAMRDPNDFREILRNRHELGALQAERERQSNRITVLQMALDELESSAAGDPS